MKFLLIAGVLCLGAAAGAAPTQDVKTAQLEYLRGMLAERRGALPEALAAYEEALRHDPRSAFISREAAELALDLGRNEQALSWARRVVELEPQRAHSHALLGRVQWALGDAESAERSFEAALKLDPSSAEPIFALGSLIAARSPDKARELLKRFLEQSPEQAAEAHFELAKIEIQTGRVKSGQKHLEQAIALEPDSDSVAARYILAQTYEAEHSTDAALGEYLKILRLEPRNVSLLNHVAQLYFTKGDWDGMRDKLLEAKVVQNDDPTANHWLAIDAERRGEWAKAADFLRASVALKSEPALNLRLSYFLTQAGSLKEAVEVLEAAEKKWPSNDQIAYFLALGYDDLKRQADAIRLLRRVLELKPHSRDARYQLAVILEKKGDMVAAEAEFRQLLAERPGEAAVLNYLGYSLADRGIKLDEAEGYIRRALAIEPGNGAFMDSLGWVHFKQGRSTEAAADLARAAAKLPEDETVWDHLGDAQAAAGDLESAWRSWKRAEALFASGAKLPGKAARVEKNFSKEELGGLYMESLERLQGGIRKVSGLCRLSGKIMGREFSYQCMVSFRTPSELELDLLGPFFTPLFRLRLAGEEFFMDPLKLEGVPGEAVAEAGRGAAELMRAYLAGAVFGLRPASYRKTWRTRRVDAPGWRFRLDRASVRVEGLASLERPGYELCLSEFGRTEGREVPRRLTVSGKGFTIGLQFDDVKIEFVHP